MPEDIKKMLNTLLDEDGNTVLIGGNLVVDATTGKSFSDHASDTGAHVSPTEKGYLTKAGNPGGVPLLDEHGNLPSSLIDTTKYPVEISVADITARDALTGLADGAKAFVEDASIDPLVDAGWAIYRYRAAQAAQGNEGEEGYIPAVAAHWTKLSEAESLDVVHDWSNLQNKPMSAVADIDDAVDKRHAHTNVNVLDGLSINGDGDLQYHGHALDGSTGIAFVADADAVPVYTGKLRLVLADYTPPAGA